MARQYELIVFGASGFTGSKVVKELYQTVKSSGKTFSWAVAGRNQKKLKATLQDVARELGDLSVNDVPILIGDVNDAASMDRCCKQATVVLNLTGPYRFYGEQVVKACVDNSTNYVDVSGEPEFIEKMYVLYGDQAKEKGITIVHTCGFDSVPADMGMEYTLSQFPDRSLVQGVESFLTFYSNQTCRANFATFESAVHGVSAQKELGRVRKMIKEKEAAQGWQLPLPKVGPTLRPANGVTLHPVLNKWIMAFPGADASVVRRTQRELWFAHHTPPAQYAAYFTISNRYYLAMVLLVATVFKFLTGYWWGRQLLLKFPSFFTFGVFRHESPGNDYLVQASFEMQFHAKAYSSQQAAEAGGAPDCVIITKVAGPEPGYISTPIIAIQAALTLLEEK
eukprot:Ihof_evm24s12 gene=Ihof_evmTU24s12